jgi:hypothetical protein
MAGRGVFAAGIVAFALALAPAAGAHGPRQGESLRPFAIKTASASDVLQRPLLLVYERSAEAGRELTIEQARALHDAGRLEAVLNGANPLTARQQELLGKGPAGVRAVAHRAGARPATATGRVPEGVHFSTGRNAVEPSLGVAPDGTLYFVGAKYDASQVPISQVQRSRDDGRTWELLDLLAKGVPDDTKTADPLIHVDPITGRLFNFDYTPPCSVISISDDRGETFRTGAACNHFDHQTLFTGPPPAGGAKPSGYPNVVYYCAIDGGASVAAYGITGCSKSLDGGITYQRVADPYVTDYTSQEGGSLGIPGFCYGATGHGRVGPDGTVFVPRGMCGRPTLARSRDEGATWEHTVIGKDLGMEIGLAGGQGIEEHEARVAIDPSGTVYYFWIARDHLPYLAVSRDGGKTFATPMMVAPPGVQEAMLPSVAAGDDGRVAFSYLGTRNSPGGPFCVQTKADGCLTADGSPGKGAAEYEKTTWDGYIGMTVEATAKDPVFQTAPVNDPKDPLHRGYCGGIACQGTHEFHDVVIAPDGTPWASFTDDAIPDPAAPAGEARGIAGRLVNGPPLIGRESDQTPREALPRTCKSRRNFVIRLREPRRGRLRSAVVTVDGRRVNVRRSRGRLIAVVDLRGRPRGGFTVRVRGRTSTGRSFRETRRYRTCAGKRDDRRAASPR